MSLVTYLIPLFALVYGAVLLDEGHRLGGRRDGADPRRRACCSARSVSGVRAAEVPAG